MSRRIDRADFGEPTTPLGELAKQMSDLIERLRSDGQQTQQEPCYQKWIYLNHIVSLDERIEGEPL